MSKPPMPLFAFSPIACFGHIQGTFTVCWRWLLQQHIHILIGIICNLQKKKKKFFFFGGGGGVLLATEMQKITNGEDNSCGQQVAGTSMLSRLIKRMRWKDTGD